MKPKYSALWYFALINPLQLLIWWSLIVSFLQKTYNSINFSSMRPAIWPADRSAARGGFELESPAVYHQPVRPPVFYFLTYVLYTNFCHRAPKLQHDFTSYSYYIITCGIDDHCNMIPKYDIIISLKLLVCMDVRKNCYYSKLAIIGLFELCVLLLMKY